MLLFSVNSKVAKRYLASPALSGEETARLLKYRSIADGTPVYLDDETMMPIEPLCSWGRSMSYADLLVWLRGSSAASWTWACPTAAIHGSRRSARPVTCARSPRCAAWSAETPLPDNLPQLLLFKDHLERARRRLPPAVFTAQWGQSWANLIHLNG